MSVSAFKLSRGLRLALLLLLLASQGIVNAHALGDTHSLDTDNCATCVLGHCLGTAIGVSHEVPQARYGVVPLPILAITYTRTPISHSHLARAPPGSPRSN